MSTRKTLDVTSQPAQLLLAAVLCACSSSGAELGDVPFPERPLLVATSDAGRASLEVRTAPEQPPMRGISKVELILTDEQRQRLSDVAIGVVTWMPAMGHGASHNPSVSSLGDGRYVLSDVELYMPGRWELRLDFSGSVDDQAVVSLDVL